MTTEAESHCLYPHLVDISNVLTVPIDGYLTNVVILVTMVTNCLVCLVLLKRNMRNATNVILVAMAISTTLTGMWRVPGNVYFFALDGYKEWVSYGWCFFHFSLKDYLSTVFHTASVWLTVALAVQRYFYVCHSQRAKRWCTVVNSVKAAVIIHVFAAALHSTRCFQLQHFPVVVPSRVDPARNVTGCCLEYSRFVPRLYFNVYYCLQLILVHLVPCTSLILLSAPLIHTMCNAQVRRQGLLELNGESESRRLAESNSSTKMIVAVVGVFLLVELPMAVLNVILVIQNLSSLYLLNIDRAIIAIHLVDLFIQLSYPTYFFIYRGMSRQFRATFKGLFTTSTPSFISERSEMLRPDGVERTQEIDTENKFSQNAETVA